MPAPASLVALLHELDETSDDIFGNRVEWKYVLAPGVAASVRAAVAARLHLEEFIPGRVKTVMHSIYFDSDDFMLYRRSVMSRSNMKFRLRTYTTHGDWTKMDPQGFFECKIGLGGKKHKLRAMMPVLKAGELVGQIRVLAPGTGRLAATGRLISMGADQRFMGKARRVLQEFKMSARLTVSYVREAFVSENGAIRITFDESYRAARIEEGSRTPLDYGRGEMAEIIAEIKFVGVLAPWLAELLAANQLPEGGQSFSKFRRGISLSYPELAPTDGASRRAEPHAH